MNTSNYPKTLAKLINLEAGLALHLKRGGAPDDETGQSLIGGLVEILLEDGAIAKLLQLSGRTPEHLQRLYTVCLSSLMPSPQVLVDHGKMAILVPTVLLIEPVRLFDAFAQVDAVLERTLAEAPELREKIMQQFESNEMAAFCELVAVLRSSYEAQQGGRLSFPVENKGGLATLTSGKGCSGVLVLLLAVVAGGCAFFWTGRDAAGG